MKGVRGERLAGEFQKEIYGVISGKLSVLRNRNLANVFYRLGFVEIFGTGITRIKQLYEEGLKQPDFEVSENTIKIVLPVFEKNLNLTEDERKIYKILSKTMLKSISEIAPYAPFGKSKTTQLLKEMGKKGVVKTEGRGRGTKICDQVITNINMANAGMDIKNFALNVYTYASFDHAAEQMA